MHLLKCFLNYNTLVNLLLLDARELSAKICEFRVNYRFHVSLEFKCNFLLQQVHYDHWKLYDFIELKRVLLFRTLALKIVNHQILYWRLLQVHVSLYVQNRSEVLRRDCTSLGTWTQDDLVAADKKWYLVLRIHCFSHVYFNNHLAAVAHAGNHTVLVHSGRHVHMIPSHFVQTSF